MIQATPSIAIDESEIEERFVRASGPGGQNVNKVSSAVLLRFDLAGNRTLPERVRARLAILAGRRMNREGALLIQASRFRRQEDNRRDAYARLGALMAAAAEPPPPPRLATRIPKSQKRARLGDKKARSGDKALRRKPGAEE